MWRVAHYRTHYKLRLKLSNELGQSQRDVRRRLERRLERWHGQTPSLRRKRTIDVMVSYASHSAWQGYPQPHTSAAPDRPHVVPSQNFDFFPQGRIWRPIVLEYRYLRCHCADPYSSIREFTKFSTHVYRRYLRRLCDSGTSVHNSVMTYFEVLNLVRAGTAVRNFVLVLFFRERRGFIRRVNKDTSEGLTHSQPNRVGLSVTPLIWAQAV